MPWRRWVQSRSEELVQLVHLMARMHAAGWVQNDSWLMNWYIHQPPMTAEDAVAAGSGGGDVAATRLFPVDFEYALPIPQLRSTASLKQWLEDTFLWRAWDVLGPVVHLGGVIQEVYSKVRLRLHARWQHTSPALWAHVKNHFRNLHLAVLRTVLPHVTRMLGPTAQGHQPHQEQLWLCAQVRRQQVLVKTISSLPPFAWRQPLTTLHFCDDGPLPFFAPHRHNMPTPEHLQAVCHTIAATWSPRRFARHADVVRQHLGTDFPVAPPGAAASAFFLPRNVFVPAPHPPGLYHKKRDGLLHRLPPWGPPAAHQPCRQHSHVSERRRPGGCGRHEHAGSRRCRCRSNSCHRQA